MAHNFLEKDKGDPATLEHAELKKRKKTQTICFGANVFHSGL